MGNQSLISPSSANICRYEIPNFGLLYTKLGGENISRFLARHHNRLAFGQLPEQGFNVGRGHHFKIFIRSGSFGADYCRSSVIERYALFGEELLKQILAERLMFLVHKIFFVTEETKPVDAPHVVYKVGIEEIHRPTAAGWWETPQHEQSRMLGSKWFQRVLFYFLHSG